MRASAKMRPVATELIDFRNSLPGEQLPCFVPELQRHSIFCIESQTDSK